MPVLSTLAKLAIALSAMTLLSGCGGGSAATQVFQPKAGVQQAGRKVYFSMRDPKGDDKGPGSYLYPLAFNNREGFFDIEKFEVVDAGEMLEFRVTTRRPIQKFRADGSSEAKGWFLQLMDIYIDKDHRPGSGVRRTLPGRFVEFGEDSGWEQMLLVSPNRTQDVRRLIESRTNDYQFVKLKPKIVIPEVVFIEGYDFVARVPRGLVGEPQPEWGYQVMMMQFEPTGLANYQFQNAKVFKFPNDVNWGGGTDFLGNPAAIDILAPTEQLQYKWLSAYNSAPNPEESELASIPMMYADAHNEPPIKLASRKPRANTAYAGPPPIKRRTVAPSQRPIARPPARKKAPAFEWPEDVGDEPAPRVTKTAEPADELEEEPPPAPVRRPRPAVDLSYGAPPAPAKRYKPVTINSSARYKTESFSGDPDDLFQSFPRSR